jgi:hypothetical protein
MKVNPIGSMSVIETTPVAAAATPAPAAAAPAPQGWGEWIAGGLWAIPGVATVADAGFAAGRVVVTTGSSLITGAYNQVYGSSPIPVVAARAKVTEDLPRKPRPPRAASAPPRALGHVGGSGIQRIRKAEVAAPLLPRAPELSVTFTLRLDSPSIVLNSASWVQINRGGHVEGYHHLPLTDHKVGYLGYRICTELTNLNPILSGDRSTFNVIYKGNYRAEIYLNGSNVPLHSFSSIRDHIPLGGATEFRCVFKKI